MGMGDKSHVPADLPGTQKAGWASGLVWKDKHIFAPTGVLTPDGSARSKSL
jgi:hypothetical protein